MFETIITTGVMLISIMMSFFHQPLNTQLSSQTTILAAIDIVDNPGKKNAKDKKVAPVDVDTPYKKKSAVKQKLSKQKIKISGYQGKTYVYGEVKPLKNNDVQGFIYRSDNTQTYVYGKKVNNTLNLYDTDGNLYQMRREKRLNEH